MKVLFFAFLALAVGANAYPYELENIENSDARGPVENAIIKAIDDLIQWIRNAGLDPLQIERLRIENSPQPGVTVGISIDQMNMNGVSNIVTHRVNYNIFSNRMQLDVSLPAIRMSVDDLGFFLDLDGTKYTAQGSGHFSMISLRFTIDMILSIRINNISVRRVQATCRMQSIWSDINLLINDVDYSDAVNDVINFKIPEFMEENQRAIDEWFSRMIYEVVNYVLSNI